MSNLPSKELFHATCPDCRQRFSSDQEIVEGEVCPVCFENFNGLTIEDIIGE
jgi:predicted amidophosphoribosyltransferase